MPLAWLTSLSLLAVSLVPPQDASSAWLCTGCIGSGASGSASGGSCAGASVSVSVTVVSSTCAWSYSSPTGSPDCRPQAGCQVSVERTWSNLPIDSTVDLCITLSPGEPTLCLGKNGTSVGPTGGGTDVRSGPALECSNEPRTYSITSDECGLTATAEVTCSACAAQLSDG